MLQICAVGWRSLLSHLMQWSSERNFQELIEDGQRRDFTRSWWIEVGWMDHEESWHDSAWTEDLHGGRVWWRPPMAKEFYKIWAHSQTSVAAMQRRQAVHQQNKAAFFCWCRLCCRAPGSVPGVDGICPESPELMKQGLSFASPHAAVGCVIEISEKSHVI